MTDIEQVRAALEEISKGIDLIDGSSNATKQNIAVVTKIILPELKRALAALARMERRPDHAALLEEAAKVVVDWHQWGPTATVAALRALKEQP